MFSVDPTLDVLARAVDRAAQVHQAHAVNLANASVPGYTRQIPAFEATLATQAPAAQSPLAATDEPVRVDQELAAMAENAVRYQLLLTTFDRTLGVLRTAAREGREG